MREKIVFAFTFALHTIHVAGNFAALFFAKGYTKVFSIYTNATFFANLLRSSGCTTENFQHTHHLLGGTGGPEWEGLGRSSGGGVAFGEGRMVR